MSLRRPIEWTSTIYAIYASRSMASEGRREKWQSTQFKFIDTTVSSMWRRRKQSGERDTDIDTRPGVKDFNRFQLTLLLYTLISSYFIECVIWDVNRERMIARLNGQPSPIFAVQASTRLHLLATVSNTSACLYSIAAPISVQ